MAAYFAVSLLIVTGVGSRFGQWVRFITWSGSSTIAPNQVTIQAIHITGYE
jgi:hypothetical protein